MREPRRDGAQKDGGHASIVRSPLRARETVEPDPGAHERSIFSHEPPWASRKTRLGHASGATTSAVIPTACRGSPTILVIMVVTDVARSAALRPRGSMQSHGDLQNVLVQARHVRHTGAQWYSSSQVRGQEEGQCF